MDDKKTCTCGSEALRPNVNPNCPVDGWEDDSDEE